MSETKFVYAWQLTIGDVLVYWDDGIRYQERYCVACRPCMKSCTIKRIYFRDHKVVTELHNNAIVAYDRWDDCQVEIDTASPAQSPAEKPKTFNGVSIE
jgi:Fe-S-cluster-containing hydrogenase component 2